jgi:hypothetical protein
MEKRSIATMVGHPRLPVRRRQIAPVTAGFCLLLAAGGAFLGSLCGCGTGEYERRLADRADRAQKQARFNQLKDPQVLEGTAVSVRLPRVFPAAPIFEGGKAKGKADAKRTKPPTGTLPGLMFTYEAFITDAEGGQLPYYCYLGAVNLADAQGKEDPAAKLRGELAGKAGRDAVADWETVQCETPDGQQSQWKKLRYTAPQEFYYAPKSGRATLVTMPAVMEIYLCEEGGYLIAIAWRMPSSIEKNVELDKWATLVAGGVTVKP